MPPLPPISNVLKMRVTFTVGGKPDQGIRLFLGHSGPAPTVTTLNALCTQITTLTPWKNLHSQMHSSVEVNDVFLQDLSSTMGAEGQSALNSVGTRAGGPLPADACFVTSYPITRRYRGGHPRTYWPLGTDTDITTPQKWKSTSVSTFQTAIRACILGLIGLTASGVTITDHANASYFKGFTLITSPTTGRGRNVPNLRPVPVVDLCGLAEGKSYVGSFRRRRLPTS